WLDWFLTITKFDYVAEDGTEMKYAIPSSLNWSGQPASWNGSYSETANSGLTCSIEGYGQGDIGCVSSLCNTLIFYAAANGVDASAASKADNTDLAAKGLYMANKLMSLQWNNARDEIGLAYEDHNTNLKRMFEQEVVIPSDYHGTMPDGSKLENGATFSSIREIYADDEMYQKAKEVYEATGATDDYYYTLHRFWHMGDTLMTTGTMALLFPEVKPLDEDSQQTTTEPTTDSTTAPTTDTTTDDPNLKVTLWGDANVDDKVTIADATAIIQALGNADEYALSAQGALNADVIDNGDGVTGTDANAIQAIEAGFIQQTDFPMSKADLDAAMGK
ncbi:MAG: hypothetical protein K2H19_09620, partial [Ruminococcus sp.]|nr:hypothetical protein [Ruminococcus sp.]